MVKTLLSQSSSLKVSKNNEKKQLNSLIKVLRPKVYITDSSSFKTLVQELTGNGITPISSTPPPPSPPPPPPPPPTTTTPQPLLLSKQYVPVVDNVIEIDQHDHYYYHHEEYYQSNADLELSFDSSEPTPFTMLESSPELSISTPFAAHDDSSLANYQMDFSVYRDIESWLLEFEPFPYHNNGYAQPFDHQQEICTVYDYDLSGLV